MRITSSAFKHGERIPTKYTCDGDDMNPPLHIEEVPKGTKTLSLIVDDPDAPVGTFVHWVVFNMDPKYHVHEDSIPGKQGMNDFNRKYYGGPCPPPGEHRYFFKFYALNIELDLEEGISKEELLQAMEGHILGQGELMGVYSRS